MFASSETIDVWPSSFSADEGDFVGVYTDGVAIGFVKLFYPLNCCAVSYMQVVWDA
jgi:hypothetical protein